MKVVWTDFATQSLKQIFKFISDNANRKIAHKIRKQVFKSTRHLIKFPESAQIESNLENSNQNYRYIISGNYKVIYRIEHTKKEIIISDVFDTRQNPIKMIDEKR